MTRLLYPRQSLAAFLFAVFLPAAAPSQTEIELFPGKEIFPLFTADALQHSLSLTRVTENSDWIGAIGGSVPVVQAAGPGIVVQAGLAVTTFNRLIKTPGHITVYTVDYRVDIPLSVRLGDLSVRAAYGHISCHFADDGIEIMGKRSIQSIKDYYTLAAAYDVSWLGGYAYANADYIYHIVPNRDKRWQLQIGGEGGNLLIAGFLRLYAAIDIKVKQQVNWGTTQSYQVGARFFLRKELPLRVSYTYRTGFDERGQFFDQKGSSNLIGLHLDF